MRLTAEINQALAYRLGMLTGKQIKVSHIAYINRQGRFLGSVVTYSIRRLYKSKMSGPSVSLESSSTK